MRGRGAGVELIPAVQKEEDFIEIVIFKQKMLENLAFPGIAEILIEEIDQEGDFLFILHSLTSELDLPCLSIDLVLLNESHHELREAGVILIRLG